MRSQEISRQRLTSLEDILEILYEKLGEFQKELVVTASTPAKTELKMRIKREILPDIRKYEVEYGQLLYQGADTYFISDLQAENALMRVIEAVERLEMQRSINYPDELLRLLTEIRAKLDEPGKTASAKLKVALPIVPAIASYELEMDTEALMVRSWQQVKSLFRGRG